MQNNFAQAALAAIRTRDGVTVDEADRAALLSWAGRCVFAGLACFGGGAANARPWLKN